MCKWSWESLKHWCSPFSFIMICLVYFSSYIHFLSWIEALFFICTGILEHVFLFTYPSYSGERQLWGLSVWSAVYPGRLEHFSRGKNRTHGPNKDLATLLSTGFKPATFQSQELKLNPQSLLSSFSHSQWLVWYGLSCVPQGSVLGTFSFSLCSTSLGAVIWSHDFSYHWYTDDNHPYLTFPPENTTILAQISACLADIRV